MKFLLSSCLGILVLFVFIGCPNPNGSYEDTGLSIGDTETVTIESETLTMIYANNSANITFPTGIDDSGTATLTTKFWMSETEVTNAVVAAVFQWAYDNGKFSGTVGDPNGLDTTTAKQGGQQLLDLDDTSIRLDYDGSGSFTVAGGYENYPVTNVTWYGAVMFCNWLTEIRDGNTDNIVYTNIDTTWQDNETSEDPSKNGYRLPSSDEWEYTARYRTDSTNTVSGYIDPYYTKGNSASNATTSFNDNDDGGGEPGKSANDAVAVYKAYWNGSTWVDKGTVEAAVKSVGAGSANSLGLYDMSGNVFEWCFDNNGSARIFWSGSWVYNATYLQIGYWRDSTPFYEVYDLGFRFCRTAND